MSTFGTIRRCVTDESVAAAPAEILPLNTKAAFRAISRHIPCQVVATTGAYVGIQQSFSLISVDTHESNFQSGSLEDSCCVSIDQIEHKQTDTRGEHEEHDNNRHREMGSVNHHDAEDGDEHND